MSTYLGYEITQNIQRANTGLSAADIEVMRQENKGTISKVDHSRSAERVTKKDITRFTQAEVDALAMKYGVSHTALSQLDDVKNSPYIFNYLRKSLKFRV